MNILLIGQATLHWGRMEFGNMGNYYIIEPFIRELHKNFPSAIIRTTLQMSDRFCREEGIVVLPMDLYYGFNGHDLTNVLEELNMVNQYLITGILTNTTPYIDRVLEADLIIDLSGDIWGDNANLVDCNRFEVGLYKDLIAQKLGKPTVMLAGSPGPFNDKKTIALAKEVFKGFSLITNREPISTELLLSYGFDISNVKNLACPAFLFEPRENKEVCQVLKKENLLDQKPKIGFIICGWNFTEGPFDRWPRDEGEYIVFAEVIEHIASNFDVDLYLLSHSNGFPIPPQNFELQHGRDYPIIKQLQQIIKKRDTAHSIKVLDGVYDPWTTKTIIGQFDMLVSGRVHAAVAALSQFIPTVIIDYGHEPKAHKLRGFAKVASMEAFVCNPQNVGELISKIDECWIKRKEIKDFLEEHIPMVKEMARQNFSILKELVAEKEES